ncbi:TMV resistance protein N isoform X2 [Prunus yedoensis var. nudiflora]|uniref:TMV resistance protein N isoform X2 n=1 Tax=Prunus yedoensis var. nudiflora TaxID=2094558 RepID=A0A314Z1A4_PRUYE|nr:TMV resistance protein N isoform X2 [Prunus yedoensis var. nudiflora]
MALDDDHRADVVDVGDHEAQRGEADHPKRRHTDLNEEPNCCLNSPGTANISNGSITQKEFGFSN